MNTMGFCVLSVLLSLAAHGGISDALSASGPPLSATPVSPYSAAPPPSLPAGRTLPDTPAGSPRNPNSKPMPAPAPTNHYAMYLTRSQPNETHASLFAV